MIQFRLSVDALGQTRFGYSPLAEVAASLRVLGKGGAGLVMQPWLRDVRDHLERVDLALLLDVAPAGPWVPDFLFAWSSDPRTTIEEQLDDLARMSPEELRRDLEDCWKGGSTPATLRGLFPEGSGEAGPRRLADAIWEYWQAAIAPYWPRIRAVVDDDVSFRGASVVTGGLFTLFADLHPEVTLQDRVLKIDKPHHRDLSYEGAQITLVPSVFVWPNLIVAHEARNQFKLTYAARGVARVWEGLPDLDESAGDLGALVGRSRAIILHRLEIPMTTTQLARELQQSPGTISQHLSVLRRNGLLMSWRSGRKVLYRCTPLAASIIAASTSTDNRGQVVRGVRDNPATPRSAKQKT
jgi:DNA-binding transcriptional ArsR family regulator